MQNFTGLVRRCIDDYQMINEGDRIAVGVSGGKDSVALLTALAEIRAYYPKKFDLTAITISMGLPGMDFLPIKELCESLGVNHIIKETRLAEIIFDVRKEKNPCALCSKMRRGALNDAIKEMGIQKLALGHHNDDAVETFLMNLFYEGRIGCFQPVTYMSRAEVYQMRPMLYAGEKDVVNYVRRRGLPVVENTCPADKNSRREDTKKLILELQRDFPDIKTKIFGAVQRYPLFGWDLPDKEK